MRRRHVPAARRSVRRGISRMLARGITRAHGRAHGRIFPRVMVRARASCCPGQGPSSGWRSPGCRPVRSRGKSPSVIRWWPERLPAEARAASRAVIRQSSGYHRSLGISRPGSHECRVVAAATDTNPVTGVRVRRGTTGAHVPRVGVRSCGQRPTNRRLNRAASTNDADTAAAVTHRLGPKFRDGRRGSARGGVERQRTALQLEGRTRRARRRPRGVAGRAPLLRVRLAKEGEPRRNRQALPEQTSGFPHAGSDLPNPGTGTANQ